MRVQLPYVRRLCEAMRLPILEFDGFEADDVIGTMAKQAAEKKLDVLVISNDKDMMQLVTPGVRILADRIGRREGGRDCRREERWKKFWACRQAK